MGDIIFHHWKDFTLTFCKQQQQERLFPVWVLAKPCPGRSVRKCHVYGRWCPKTVSEILQLSNRYRWKRNVIGRFLKILQYIWFMATFRLKHCTCTHICKPQKSKACSSCYIQGVGWLYLSKEKNDNVSALNINEQEYFLTLEDVK